MKKIVLLIATLLLAFAMVACVNGTADNTESQSAESVVYRKAQELGFEGSLEEFKALCKGSDGKGVVDAYVNGDDLMIVLSDGSKINVGSVVGKTGESGVGITKTEIDGDGNLLIYYSDAPETPVNLGKVVGEDGVDGAKGEDGIDGVDGVGIVKTEIDGDGNLLIYYSNAPETPVNLGKVVGEDGEDGNDAETSLITLTFDSNGGETCESVTASLGTSVDLPIPTREGYIFLGWYYNDVQFTDITPLSRDMTLVAKWQIEEDDIIGDVDGPITDGPIVDYVPPCTAHTDGNGDAKCDICDTDMPLQDDADAEETTSATHNPLLSAVSVKCFYEENEYSWNGSVIGTQRTASIASGVIYKLDKETGDAYIITNYHVVYNCNSTSEDGISNEIYVFLYGMEYQTADGKNYAIPAEFVGGAMSHDIAVLKVSGSEVLKASNACAPKVADSDKVAIFDKAVVAGNPQAEGLSATTGTICLDSEEITVGIDTLSGTVTVYLRVIRTDAALNRGNSGGGLYNEHGELIGIVCAKDPDGTIDNVGYAIPINVAAAIADNAIYYSDGTVKKALLGVTVGVLNYYTVYDEKTGKVYKMEDVVISNLSETSILQGHAEIGDVINSITVDGVTKEVTRIHHVVDSMLNARVGSVVTLNLTRGGVDMEVSITVTADALTLIQ